MRNFLAALCVASLLFSSVAVAGGLSSRLAPESSRLAKLISKTKQWGASLAIAGVLTCGTIACNNGDEAARALAEANERVTTLEYGRSARFDAIITHLEQAEGAQIGIVAGIDSQGVVKLEADGGTIYMQLLEGEVLINGSELPLKVTLSEEVVDEGVIAEGSRLAIIPAFLVAGGLLILSGVYAVDSLRGSKSEAFTVASIGTFVAATTGTGTYHLLVML